ncbi:MAG: fibronectin type III domain-containing protein [Halobacteriales archaeon]|nr:fibronectin type III domain-containing protein [Halobacteriales archaeon]
MANDTSHTYDETHSTGSESLKQFQRNRFFHGKLMTARDMVIEQDYHSSRFETFTRTVAGRGIVCGLGATVTEDTEGTLDVTVEGGYAQDAAGRPIVVETKDDKSFAEQEWMDAEVADEDADPNAVEGLSVYIRYRDCQTEKVPINGAEDACGEDCTFNRIVSDYEILVRRGQPAAYKPVYDLSFPSEDELDTYDPAAQGAARDDPRLQKIARTYKQNRAKHEPTCGPSGEGLLFLGHWTKTNNAWSRQQQDDRPRPHIYSNDMLYAAIARHATDFENPHNVVATVEGVDPDDSGDLRLESSDNTITIEVPPDSSAHSVNLTVDGKELGLDDIKDRLQKLEAIDREAPNTPTNLEVKSTTTTEVDLRWQGTTDVGDSGIQQYRIYMDGSEELAVPQSKTTATVTGLQPDTQYEFTVSAVDAANNESQRSNAVTATTKPDVDDEAPPTPTNLSVSATTATSITVGWDSVTDTGGSGLDHYNVYVTDRSTPTTVASGTTQITINSLQPGTGYKIGVSAVDGKGNESAQATTTAPTALKEITVQESSTSAIPIRWQGPSSSEGLDVDRYVSYKNGQKTGGVGSSSMVFTGLAPGTVYELGIAVEAGGTQSSTTTVLAPTTPANLKATVSGGGSTSMPTTINVTWNPPVESEGQPPELYYLRWESAENGSTPGEARIDEPVYQIRRNIQANTEYVITVVAVSNDEIRSGVAQTTITTPPERSFVPEVDISDGSDSTTDTGTGINLTGGGTSIDLTRDNTTVDLSNLNLNNTN